VIVQYVGALYGKAGVGKYFPLGWSSKDVDALECDKSELLAMLDEMATGGDSVCGFDDPCTCRFCRARALVKRIKEARN
jgi:hypothetical protein